MFYKLCSRSILYNNKSHAPIIQPEKQSNLVHKSKFINLEV